MVKMNLVASHNKLPVYAEPGRTEAVLMGTGGTAANEPQSYRVGDRQRARARSE